MAYESPGEMIKDELAMRGWSQALLAEFMGRTQPMVNDIVNGKRPLTLEFAIQLEAVFEIPAQDWLALEAKFRVARERSSEAAKKSQRATLLRTRYPVAEMVKAGWLDRARVQLDVEDELQRFLNADPVAYTPDRLKLLRAKLLGERQAFACEMWQRRVEEFIDREVGLVQLDVAAAVADVLALTNAAEGVARVGEVLRSHGIQLIVVEQLPGTRLDGALIRTESHPVIALTARLKRIDYFYFTLMHELAHLELGHEGSIDALEVSPTSVSEKQADKRAGEWLIPQQAYEQILARSHGRFSAQFVEEQARLIRRHPGILVGRLQRDEYIPWSYLRPFLENVGDYLETLKEGRRPRKENL